MNVLLTIPGWHDRSGGPFHSVGHLASYLGKAGCRVTLFTASFPSQPAQAAPDGVRMRVTQGLMLPVISQSITPRAYREVLEEVRQSGIEVIHDNSQWLSLNHAVARVARKTGLPRMISPRGTLSAWALQYRSWKKQLALRLYQRKDLESATCFHATSPEEADSIRSLGLKQPVFLIPNGVDIPEAPAYFREETPRTALFLGRLHPVKNLDTLIRAWAKARPEGWRLRMVGADEVGLKADLLRLAADLGIAEEVHIEDPVYGADKWRVLREAQVVFLVSKSENFGIAAAEALATGVPVVAARSTPWSCLETHQLGWWVEGSEAGLADCLRSALSGSPASLRAMGLRGRTYAIEQYSWPSIALQVKEVYQWMQSPTSMPHSHCE